MLIKENNKDKLSQDNTDKFSEELYHRKLRIHIKCLMFKIPKNLTNLVVTTVIYLLVIFFFLNRNKYLLKLKHAAWLNNSYEVQAEKIYITDNKLFDE